MRVLIKITFCYIHTTVSSEKARGPYKLCPRATCGWCKGRT